MSARHLEIGSYIFIEKKVPMYELLETTINKYQSKISENLKNVFDRFMNVKSMYPPGFAIKNQKGELTFETYFYMYNPHRENHLQIHLLNDNFTDDILSQYDDSILTLTHLPKDKTLYILSLDIDNDYIQGNKTVTTYYTENGRFLATKKSVSLLQEDLASYGQGYHFDIVYAFKEHYDMARRFQSDETHIFAGIKDSCKRFSFYMQNVTFTNFIVFLKQFLYEPLLINDIIEIYNDDFVFDVSFDFDSSGNIIRSAIYGILAKDCLNP